MEKKGGNVLWTVFDNWINNTTVQGIPNINKSKFLIIKIFWILCVLTCFTWSIYFIYKAVLDYFEYPRVTSTNSIRETNRYFPAVTICNLNSYKTGSATMMLFKSYNDSSKELQCVSDYTNTSQWISCYGVNDVNQLLAKFNDETKRFLLNNRNITINDLYNSGYDLANDMLISCSFNGNTCTSNDFTKFWHNQYGVCYTFNNKQPYLQTSMVGPEAGFKIELNTRYPNGSLFSFRNGIYLLIHNQTESNIDLSGGIYVSTGSETYVGITKVVSNINDDSYCLSNDLNPFSAYSSKIFDYFNDLNVSYYDQQLCFDLCYQDQLIQRCNCCDLVTTSLNKTQYCQSIQEMKCQNNFRASFFLPNITVLCKDVCRYPCETQSFQIATRFSKYPDPIYVKRLYDVHPEFFSDPRLDIYQKQFYADISFLKVIVNYDNHFYIQIDDKKQYTVTTLISNIGGQLSLFLGATIISFAEIFHILLELVATLFLQHNKLNKVTKSEQTL